ADRLRWYAARHQTAASLSSRGRRTAAGLAGRSAETNPGRRSHSFRRRDSRPPWQDTSTPMPLSDSLVTALRSEFPALDRADDDRADDRATVFFDGPGGTQAPRRVTGA